MPRFDGTGPLGFGARTGKGMGRCSSLAAGYRGMGMGMGMGRGRGFGAGLYIGQTKEDEITSLKNEARIIEDHLNNIKQRISELEK